MKLVRILVSLFALILFMQSPAVAENPQLASTAPMLDYDQILKTLGESRTLQLTPVDMEAKDGGSCSVTCTNGSASKTCATKDTDCSCSCDDKGNASCSACF